MGKAHEELTAVEVGYAANREGYGVAYAALGGTGGSVLRLPFRMSRGATCERAAGYAAVVTVARALGARGLRRVRLRLPDSLLVDELTTGRELPRELALPYVFVRCALNALQCAALETGASEELAQRARAEVALNLAA